MASPRVHLRLDERLHGRALQAAESEGSTLSEFVRAAILAKLGAVRQEVAERAALLAEARAFLADPDADRDAAGLVERYCRAVEAQAGRISLAEAHGRATALAEVCSGALEPLDGHD